MCCGDPPPSDALLPFSSSPYPVAGRCYLCSWCLRWVKGSPIGVLFPVLIAVLAPLRLLLVNMNFFSNDDMVLLDSEG